MGYVKHKAEQIEYTGESFSKTLYKKSGEEWSNEDTATYSLYDTDGVEKSTGSLIKSNDNMSMSFLVPSADTQNLLGKYKLLVTLGNSSDARINDVIAEYNILYNKRTANTKNLVTT